MASIIRKVKDNLKKIPVVAKYVEERHKLAEEKADLDMRTMLNKRLKARGIEILDSMTAACNEMNVPFWLELGTLLGAYRDKTFMDHDYDLDVCIFENDYNDDFDKKLQKFGFSVKRKIYLVNRKTQEKRLYEIVYYYKDFAMDMSLAFMEGNQRNVLMTCAYKGEHEENEYEVHVYTHGYPLPLEDVYINGKRFNAPANPVETLSNIYGKNFMTPDPHWCTTGQYTNVKILDFKDYYATMDGEW